MIEATSAKEKTMESKYVKVQADNGIWTVSLNRPDAMNSLDMNILEELIAVFSVLDKDETCRVVVLTGEGKAFCAGGDFKLPLFNSNSSKLIFEDMEIFGKLILTMRNLTKPIIAAVNGAAVGAGMNVALACDIVICSNQAKFGEVFCRLGVHPDCGGTYFLPRAVGTYQACELMFTGEIFPAQKAVELGIANRVVEHKELMNEVYKLATKIAQGPPVALSLTKQSIYQGIGNDLASQLRLESLNQTICMLTKDKEEGLAAFKEKREPRFKGL